MGAVPIRVGERRAQNITGASVIILFSVHGRYILRSQGCSYSWMIVDPVLVSFTKSESSRVSFKSGQESRGLLLDLKVTTFTKLPLDSWQFEFVTVTVVCIGRRRPVRGGRTDREPAGVTGAEPTETGSYRLHLQCDSRLSDRLIIIIGLVCVVQNSGSVSFQPPRRRHFCQEPSHPLNALSTTPTTYITC